MKFVNWENTALLAMHASALDGNSRGKYSRVYAVDP